MAGAVRQVVRRSGRYRARVVVPEGVCGIIGQSELCMSPGGDQRRELRLLAGSVAKLQGQIRIS